MEICKCGHPMKLHLKNREDETKMSGTNTRMTYKQCKMCNCTLFVQKKKGESK